MGPHFTLLLAALANCLCPGRPCIKCDQFVTDALKTFENTYLNDHLPHDIHKNVMRMVNHEVSSFGVVTSAEDSYLGAVGKEGRSRCRPRELGRGRAGARSPSLGVTGTVGRMKKWLGVVVHAFIPGTWEAEAGLSLPDGFMGIGVTMS
jgi:hypothetical protein